MRKFNFLSKSSSRSCGHSSVTSAMTVGSPSVHRRETMLKLLSVLVLILTFGVGQMWGGSHTWSYTFALGNLSTSSGNKTFTGKIDNNTNKNVTWACSAATFIGWDSGKVYK